MSPRSRRCSSASPLTLSLRHRRRPATVSAVLLSQSRAFLNANDLERAKARAEAALAQRPRFGRGPLPARARSPSVSTIWRRRRRRTRARSSTRRGWPRRTIGSGSCSASRGAPRRRSPSSQQAVRLNPALFDAQYHLGATRWWTRDLDGALPRAAGGGHAAARPRRGALLPRADARSARPARAGDRRSCATAVRLNPSLARARTRLGHRAAGLRRSRRRDRAARGRGPPRRRRPPTRRTASGSRCRRRVAATKRSRCCGGWSPAQPGLPARAAESRHRADAAGQAGRSRRPCIARCWRSIPRTPRPSTTLVSR